MRIVSTLFTIALTGCETGDTYVTEEGDEYNYYGDTESDTDVDTGTESDTETVYYVPDMSNQVHETNTHLEFRNGSSSVQESDVATGSLEHECMLVTVGVPADASQGVFLERVDFGAYGIDLEGSGWLDGLETYGAGSNLLFLNDLLIFRDSDEWVGAEAYYLNSDIFPWYGVNTPNWHSQFGCFSDACQTRAWIAHTNYYIPPGVDATIGYCTQWWQGSVIDWQTQEREYEKPAESDWLQVILGGMQWRPADTQEFTSDSVDGLIMPVSGYAFREE